MAVYHEYIIIGAGPAGLQMGYFMEKDKADYLILEGSNRPGNFFTTQPRHRTLISINKVHNPFPEKEYNMRHDWNSLLCDDDTLRFTKYTEELFPHADVLVRYLNDFAHKNNLNIIYQTYINNITKVQCAKSGEDRFKLTSKEGKEYECRVLLMATGATKDIIPDIPGIELADTYSDHSTNQSDYTGKFVAIMGRGNSAFEVANYLSAHASVIHLFGQAIPKFAWDSHFVGDLRAVNNNLLDMFHLKSLHSYTALNVVGLKKTDKGKIEVQAECDCLHYDPPVILKSAFSFDKVILCAGFKYVDLDIFDDSCKPATRKADKFPVLKENWESENVPNMFFIGTAMQSRDRKAASGFIHGFRYNVRTLYHLLREKYDDVPYHTTELGRDAMAISDHIVHRVSICASLYQQQSFLCDVVIVPEESDKKPIYYEDLPVEYVFSKEYFTSQTHMFVVVLTYTFDRHGKHGEIATRWGFSPNLFKPDCQAFLRPGVSYYNKGKFAGEEFCNESLLLRFDIKNFKNYNIRLNFNRIGNFINKHTNLSPGAHYDTSLCTSEEAHKKMFVPLNEEQMKRLPPEFFEMKGSCKPATMALRKDPAMA
ncbi:FAD-dependent oxidoreductase domain-containing protein 2-like [Ptychodera flava]|uniref:FAD-dependent oxidoreductase domain-containing protein 2-like n=1 Tax=Ptychodera flava TaxID=63121 RepID=UPI00396A0E04